MTVCYSFPYVLFRYMTDDKARLEGCAPLHRPKLRGGQRRG
jgi:hypothetical protein